MCELLQKMPGSSTEFPESANPSPASTPLNLWEIDTCFRCPVVGMCLTTGEQKQLLKKVGISLKNKTLYDIHEILVSGADSESRLSHKVQRLLHRKYGREAGEMHQLSEHDFMCQWNAAFDLGDYLTEFWAAATRPYLSVNFKKDIFGAIHMAMHANAALSAQATRLKEELEDRVTEQAQKIKELQRERRTLRRETQGLKSLLAASKSTLQCAEQEIKQLRNQSAGEELPHSARELKQENLRMAAVIANQADHLASRDRRIASMTEQVAQLTERLTGTEQAEALFRQETQGALQAFLEINRCDSGCPAFDLCNKRVLIVGGIARMESLYRRLIENNGGLLEYHDGCVNGGTKKLENHFKRSDIVICPVNCNSHAACTMVKHLGKKHKKSVHMLANFSLSAVSQVIRNCGADPAPRN